MRLLLIASTLLAVGCEAGDECKRLTGMVSQYEDVLETATRRAENAERFGKEAEAAKQEAKEALERLGFDLAEGPLVEDLDKRLAAIPGATKTRRVESFGPAEEAASNAKTIFTISFREKDPSKVWTIIEGLVSALPLWRLELVRVGSSPDLWEVELVRAVVEQLPIKPKPTPLPELPDPSTVPTELRFCGAGKLRTRLAELKAQIEKLREPATNTTVLLPAIASWKGLKQRAQVLEAVELESRKLQKLFFEAAVATKSKLKAVGYQEPRAVLEVFGGKAERAALERALAKHRSRLAIPEDNPDPKVIRFTLANTAVPEFRREPAPGTPGGPPAGQPDGHEGHGHGPGGH